MSGPPKTAVTQRFNDAPRSMLLVSKGDLNRMREGERWAKIGKPKPGPKASEAGNAPKSAVRSLVA